MKHGPIALIDEDMPVVAIATGDRVYEKVKSNMQEVKARDGVVIALTDRDPEELRRHRRRGDPRAARSRRSCSRSST